MVIDGGIDIGWLKIDRLGVIDRGEEDAAGGQRQIPVAFDEQVSPRRPDEVRRNPDPARLDGRPEAGAPDVACVLPVPASRRPEDVGGGGGAVRPGLEASRRRGDVGRLSLGGGLRLGSARGLAHGNPCAGDPLVSSLDLVPVAGHPLPARRRLAPDAADPEEIVAAGVPAPVPGDPLDVLPRGLLVGGISSTGAGGCLATVSPGLGSWTTGKANASWTGPRVKTCTS